MTKPAFANANNKDADQLAHPRSLISAFVVRCLDSIIPLLAQSIISRLWLVSVAEQAGLSLIRSQSPKTGFLVTKILFATAACKQSQIHKVPKVFPKRKKSDICNFVICTLIKKVGQCCNSTVYHSWMLNLKRCCIVLIHSYAQTVSYDIIERVLTLSIA